MDIGQTFLTNQSNLHSVLYLRDDPYLKRGIRHFGGSFIFQWVKRWATFNVGYSTTTSIVRIG